MPRSCTVCGHAERHGIDAALASGEANRRIATQHGLTEAAVRRHAATHLPAAMVKAEEARQVAHGSDVLTSLQEAGRRVQLLSDACDAWLRDAEDPTRYDIGPRSEEVWVTYEEDLGDGKTKRRKARLADLLDQAMGKAGITLVETKYSDPRELILKSYDRLQGMLELIAKLLHQLDQTPPIYPIILAPEWAMVRAALFAALAPYPDARAAVAQQLLTVEVSSARN